MRIIGRLKHPQMSITVFSNDGRFPVQFEYRGLRQQYRFRHGPELKNLSDIEAIVDAEFQRDVLATFQRMQQTHARVLGQMASPDNELPDII